MTDALPMMRLRRFALLLPLTLMVACATSVAQLGTPWAKAACPRGTFDYGDGMVASMLTEKAQSALLMAHQRALAAAQTKRSTFLTDVPWRPHVSLIYGVTPERAQPAIAALHTFLQNHKAAEACAGGLQYWDDAKGGKTTLVLDIVEPAHMFSELHEALAQGANIGSRFAYNPHVTLMYLHEGERLEKDEEAHVLAAVAGVCWPATAFYVTNPCGQEIYQDAVRQ